MNQNVNDAAISILKQAYGDDADFRGDQLGIINSVLNNRRTLVVQKTGWGKSIIYFITAKILKAEDKGITLIISPLLELMANQKEFAELFGLKCGIINGNTAAEIGERIWNQHKERYPKAVKKESQGLINQGIAGELTRNNYDIIFSTPEQLVKDYMQIFLNDNKIGMFVVDEAHCMSDWGHDFRREYSRLYKIMAKLPDSARVLCTTATANDRVINDLKRQFGDDIYISRGDLTRDSLYLDAVSFATVNDKYAYLLEHINKMPGTGIIYCLTKRDCENVSSFLNSNGIAAKPFYSDNVDENKNDLNAAAMEKFKKNELKALVSTIKLGMGYDKPDVSFVIHFQIPQNTVAYYQQIGRAGRAIDKAYAILMGGPEDEKILDYFIENAFPSEELCNRILSAVPASGAGLYDIISKVNAKQKQIKEAIKFLTDDGYLEEEYADKIVYYPTQNKFEYPEEHKGELKALRTAEKNEMLSFVKNKGDCLLARVINSLNGETKPCGRCSACTGKPFFETELSKDSQNRVKNFLDNNTLIIEPRKSWPNGIGLAKSNYPAWADKLTYIKWNDKTKRNEKNIKMLPLSQGFSLAKYADPGYGAMVSHDKYNADNYREELLVRAADALTDFIKENDISLITYVPSLRNDKLKIFAREVAKRLNLPCVETLCKDPDYQSQQKNMENSKYRCENAAKSFDIVPGLKNALKGNALLIDDIVDSKWTIVVCGHLLMANGCDNVYPFCLADSGDSQMDSD